MNVFTDRRIVGEAKDHQGRIYTINKCQVCTHVIGLQGDQALLRTRTWFEANGQEVAPLGDGKARILADGTLIEQVSP